MIHDRAFQLALVLAVALCGVACGVTTQFTPTNTSPRPMVRRPLETVQLFTTTKPDRGYVEVGIITSRASGEFSGADDGAVIAELRTKGAEVGCDGVLMAYSSSDAYASRGNALVGASASEKLKFSAVCIVFNDP